MASKTFSENLSNLMKQRGWSYAALALRIGVTKKYVGTMLHNYDQSPTLSVAVRIANVFGVSLDWLVGDGGHLVDQLSADEQEWLSLFRSVPPGEVRLALMESTRLFVGTFAGIKAAEDNVLPNTRP